MIIGSGGREKKMKPNTKGLVVFMSGCWDLFHVGHLNALMRAEELGDILIVGVVTDELMRAYKAEPIIPFEQRCEIVNGLRCVDYAVPYDDTIIYEIVERYGVDIRAVGSQDGILKTQREQRKELERRGVEHTILPRTPNISTTEIKKVCCEALVSSGGCPFCQG